jgi:formamidopyrimidine-DNA glycosylase
MPELPEAERARQQIEKVLGRRIVAVDDADGYVCRPHGPGEINDALAGRTLIRAHRRGKFLWIETDDGGPDLGLHLGMAGRIVVDGLPAPRNWDRFSLEFEDGGRLALRDKRRLSRAVIDPDHSHIGPDAGEISRAAFRSRVGRGTMALKARLLDQGVLAGVGNLLADETLWQARLSPNRPAGSLAEAELNRLRVALRAAIRSAIRKGGVHTGAFIQSRKRGGACPRCRTPLERATVGGRTTFWCPHCQPDPGS